jgi:hypothetical protein
MADKKEKKLGKSELMDEFEVLYLKNHGGTFNGCLETLGISIESYLKGLVRDRIPLPIIFDQRTSVGKCFEFLMGRRKPFYVIGANGQETRQKYGPFPPLFTQEANDLIEDWLETRNFHVHEASLYSMMARFKNIAIPIGPNHVLIFNPGLEGQPQRKLRIDEVGDILSDPYQLLLRQKKEENSFDMVICEFHHADLILEVLTKNEFEGEHTSAEWHFGTHALVLYYGTQIYYVCISQSTRKKLRDCFADPANSKWKTHYFRFKAESIFSRMTQ